MPSNHPDDKWFIRVTESWDVLEAAITKLKAWEDLQFAIVGFHKGDKTHKEHVHIVLQLTKTLQKQSLVHRLKNVFGALTASSHSCKPWDGSDNAISYLYHDKHGKVEYHKVEMTEERLAAIMKVAEEKAPKNTLTFQQKGKKSNLEFVLERIALEKEAWSMTKIAKFIANEMAEGRWTNRGKHQMAAIVEEIWLRQTWIGMDPREKEAAKESVAMNWVRLLV